METPGCPSCGHREATTVGFTWWGGWLGPQLLAHVRCEACGVEYNGRTGRSNSTAITIYLIVGIAIGIGVAVAFGSMR